MVKNMVQLQLALLFHSKLNFYENVLDSFWPLFGPQESYFLDLALYYKYTIALPRSNINIQFSYSLNIPKLPFSIWSKPVRQCHVSQAKLGISPQRLQHYREGITQENCFIFHWEYDSTESEAYTTFCLSQMALKASLKSRYKTHLSVALGLEEQLTCTV